MGKPTRVWRNFESRGLEYAVCGTSDDHTWPVASLKPNDFGMFDMQGNAIEWVYDAFSSYPSTYKDSAADAPNTKDISETGRRVLRGGSFINPASTVRSARRSYFEPGNRVFTNGFRPSRTYNLSP